MGAFAKASNEAVVLKKTFKIEGESVLASTPCSVGTRLGRLWLTFDNFCFYSSILGLSARVIMIPFDNVNAAWKIDTGMISAMAIQSDSHGEIEMSVPVDRDRIFEVLDQILKMRRQKKVSTNEED